MTKIIEVSINSPKLLLLLKLNTLSIPI